MANDTEKLLWALLIWHSGHYSASELKLWAKAALQERSQAEALKEAWVPKLAWDSTNTVSGLFDPVVKAFHQTAWSNPDLDALGRAIQGWEGDGAFDNLTVVQLRDYIKVKPLSFGKSKKRAGPPRFRSWQLLQAAEIILKKGAAIRHALGGDVEMEKVPTSHERAAAAAAQVIELQSELDVAKEALRKAADARRKVAERTAAKAAARPEKREAAKQQKQQKQQKQKQQVAAAVEAKVAKKAAAVEKRLVQKFADDKIKRTKEVSDARARARKVETEAKSSRSRLKRLHEVKAEVDKLRTQLDEAKEAEEALESPETDDEPGAKKGRRDERGRFEAEPWQLRVLKWAQLGRGVSPSSINANITEVMLVYASNEVAPQPCPRQMRKLRGEVTIAGEMIAALRVALSIRIISFGFDESTKFGLGLLSSNTQIEPNDAPGTSVDVVMRGATLTAGGTAEKLSKEIEVKLFAHARRLLTIWKEEHEKMHGVGSWAKADMPAPDNVGLHRLAENAVIMSDTCNAARATKRLVAEMAEAAGRAKIGADVWEKMSEEEQQKKVKCHLGDCHGHLRNIIVKAMCGQATEYLKDKLGDSLDEFSAYDRMSTDGMDLIRAACKELHPNGQYAKGKGREGKAWREKMHASAFWLPLENAAGSRQDMALDGAVPLYMNRTVILDFMRGLVDIKGANNQLEKFLWRTLACNEIVALLRTCTLWQTILTEPMRWLTGKSTELDGWSLASSNELLDVVYDVMEKVAADGNALFDLTLDPYAAIAAKQPKFAERRAKQMQAKVTAPDGTEHFSYTRTLDEARSPTTPGNVQSTPMAVELAQRMATGALVATDARREAGDRRQAHQPGWR